MFVFFGCGEDVSEKNCGTLNRGTSSGTLSLYDEGADEPVLGVEERSLFRSGNPEDRWVAMNDESSKLWDPSEFNDNPVYTLITQGDYLYVGGSFSKIKDIPAKSIARLHIPTNTWSALSSGIDGYVNTIVFDTSGNLYAGGKFTVAGTVSANNIVKWDGEQWSALGSGLNHNIPDQWEVYGMSTSIPVAISSNGQLFVGGNFKTAGQKSTPYLANYLTSNLSNGTECSINSECSTLFCVDAVCCEAAGCDDGNPCTIDSCSASGNGTCTHIAAPQGTSCSDNNACNGSEMCSGDGICLSGSPLSCDDGNQCTVDSCDAVLGCRNDFAAEGSFCDDANNETENDICVTGGICSGTQIEGSCETAVPVTDFPFESSGTTDGRNSHISSYGENCGEESASNPDEVFVLAAEKDVTYWVTVSEGNFVKIIDSCQNDTSCGGYGTDFEFTAEETKNYFIVVESELFDGGEYTVNIEKINIILPDDDAISDTDATDDPGADNDFFTDIDITTNDKDADVTDNDTPDKDVVTEDKDTVSGDKDTVAEDKDATGDAERSDSDGTADKSDDEAADNLITDDFSDTDMPKNDTDITKHGKKSSDDGCGCLVVF